MTLALVIATSWLALVALLSVIVGWWFAATMFAVSVFVGGPLALYAWWWIHTWVEHAWSNVTAWQLLMRRLRR